MAATGYRRNLLERLDLGGEARRAGSL